MHRQRKVMMGKKRHGSLHHDFQQGQSRLGVLISFALLHCFPSESTSQTPLGAAFPSGQDPLLNPWSVCSLQGHRGHAAHPLAGAAAAGAALAGRHSRREAGPAHRPAGCHRLPGLRSLGLHDGPQPGHRGWPEPVVRGVLQSPPLRGFGKRVLEFSLVPALACATTWLVNMKLLVFSFEC